MIQAGDGFRLALEALANVRVRGEALGQDLDRDRSVEGHVARAIDLSHPTRAQRRDDLVVRQLLSRRKRNRQRVPIQAPSRNARFASWRRLSVVLASFSKFRSFD